VRGRSTIDADWTERYFARLLAVAVGVAAAVRGVYVLRDHRALIGGDGFDYVLSANRIAHGLGYTSAFGEVGKPIAHHPPGWVTVLAVVNWLGPDSQRADQLVCVIIGLGVVLVAGLVGRRLFNARVGLVAAVLAAIYPGFWLLDGNILSEPLGLLLVGVFTLAVAAFHGRPTMSRVLVVGSLCGILALVRSEQIALVFLVVAPVVLMARTLSFRRRVALLTVAASMTALMIAPWAIYNSTRFNDPVLLSTNDGSLLLLGNCPPASYEGPELGYYVQVCGFRLAKQHPKFDRSQLDSLARHEAVHNITANLDKMPRVVPARFGRMLAVFHPSQTVGFVATWMTTGTGLIWAWVLSYLLLLPFALIGGISARRERRFILPLLGPFVIVVVSVGISYGEPRYHSPSDLSAVVLAAAGIDWLLRRFRPSLSPGNDATTEPFETRTGD
jgi:4-amino-4-deoxy-L-arabinose transferase-like glycosyltransferase